MNNLFRLTEDFLLNINYNQKIVSDVFKYEDPTNSVIQFLNIVPEEESNIELMNTVWYDKIDQFGKKLNHYWLNDENFIKINDLTRVESYVQTPANLYIGSGFSWDNVFGIVLVLKDKNTDVIYKSRLFKSAEFLINPSIEIINNKIWTSTLEFLIPDIKNIMGSISFGIEIIKFDDVHQDNDILNYPVNFESLIMDMPLSDKLAVELTFDESLFLNITPKSNLEEFTIEQLLLWNFDIDKINNIQVDYLITYNKDNNGNKTSITVSDYNYPLNPIVVGLPLINNPDNKQLIEVTAYFTVNGMTATRYQNVVWDYANTMNAHIATYIATINDLQEVNPVSVVEEINIENKVINTQKEIISLNLSVPTFVEMNKELTVVLENKNIAFKDVTLKSYIICNVNEENDITTISQKLSNGSFYFDISEINSKLLGTNIKELPFKLFNYSDNKLIGEGKFIR